MAESTQSSVYRSVSVDNVSSSVVATMNCFCSINDYVPPEAIRDFTLQHNSDKRDLQDLNERFSDYLRRLKALEDENRRLQSILDDRKRQSGFDSSHIKDQYDADLQALRKRIDAMAETKSQAELAAKRAELDALMYKNRINFLNRLITLDNDRLVKLRQKLEESQTELQALGQRTDDRSQDLERVRNTLEELYKELTALKDRFDGEAMARVIAQNELQTLEEEIAFRRAVHEEERNELASLGALPFDNQQFYRVELSRAINLIKSDFEKLARERRKDLDEFHKYRTDEFNKQVRQWEEQNRQPKPVVTIASDFASVQESLQQEKVKIEQIQTTNQQLSSELQQLQGKYDQLAREKEDADAARKQDYDQLCRDTQALERALADIVSSNVSLRSDINVYRRLLEIQPELPEIQRPPSPLPPPERSITEIRTMTVQKTSQGPVAIVQADLDGDFIALENSGSTIQELGGWTLRRAVDSQPEIVYHFSDGFILAPGVRLRILSRRGRANVANTRDSLVANDVPTWGLGDLIETRLYDETGTSKAYFKQSFI